MSREVRWFRHARPANLTADWTDGTKPVYTIFDLGFEEVCGPPLYEVGDFVVVDTIKDLVYVVAMALPDGRMRVMREVRLDKYEAIRVADEFAEAALR